MKEEIKWKLPHIIKIPEAYTAYIDKRYKRDGEGRFLIFSSDYSKQYTVTIFDDGYASNDNMSYNNGVLGYPIVVILILENKLAINQEIAALFSKINWTETNLKFEKNFTLSMEMVIKEVVNEKYSYEAIYANIQKTYLQLQRILSEIRRYESPIPFLD